MCLRFFALFDSLAVFLICLINRVVFCQFYSNQRWVQFTDIGCLMPKKWGVQFNFETSFATASQFSVLTLSKQTNYYTVVVSSSSSCCHRLFLPLLCCRWVSFFLPQQSAPKVLFCFLSHSLYFFFPLRC